MSRKVHILNLHLSVRKQTVVPLYCSPFVCGSTLATVIKLCSGYMAISEVCQRRLPPCLYIMRKYYFKLLVLIDNRNEVSWCHKYASQQQKCQSILHVFPKCLYEMYLETIKSLSLS